VTRIRLLASLCTLALSCPAWADAPQPPASTYEDPAQFASALRVEVISCVLEESAVDVSEMLAIARAELAPHVLVRADEKNSQPLLRVDACHDERLVLKLLSPEGPEQSIALHDVPPEHRPRVAALALAELVLTARTVGEWRAERAAKSGEATGERASGGSTQDTAQSALSARLPDWNANGPETSARHPMRLGFGAEARLFCDGLSVGYGARVTLRFTRADLVLLGLFSRKGVDYGELSSGVVAMNSAVHLWRSPGALDFAVSLGLELGASWGRADPRASSFGARETALYPFASAFGQLSLGGAISDQAYAHAILAAGYAALGVHAKENSDAARTDGAFVSLSAGFGWSL
jgi:hypothetical protein